MKKIEREAGNSAEVGTHMETESHDFGSYQTKERGRERETSTGHVANPIQALLQICVYNIYIDGIKLPVLCDFFSAIFATKQSKCARSSNRATVESSEINHNENEQTIHIVQQYVIK